MYQTPEVYTYLLAFRDSNSSHRLHNTLVRHYYLIITQTFVHRHDIWTLDSSII